MKRLVLAVALALSGCMVGPNYTRPTTPTQSVWKEQSTVGATMTNATSLPPSWWEIFSDTDLNTLEQRLLAFETRYNTTASPFDWRYTKTDLNAYLKRLAAHEPLSPAA